MAGKFAFAGTQPLSPTDRPELAAGVGVGLKQPHINALMADPTKVDFIEIHAENYMVPGPRSELLADISQIWPVSVHGVALSLGGDDPLDKLHLSRLKQLIETARPALVSEHIAWSSHDGTYFNDLLPIPYDKQSLTRLSHHVQEAQDYLGRQILLENPASYVRFQSDTMHEADFIAELVHHTGCGLLLDINNLFVSAHNHGWSIENWLSRIPLETVGELHLAGHEQTSDNGGNSLLVDTHGDKVSDVVWFLYCEFLAQAGPRPTLIERDNNIPPFDDILQEVGLAKRLMQTTSEAPV